VASGPTAEGRRGRWSWWRPALPLAITLAFVAFVEWYAGWTELLRPWRALTVGALVAATLLMMLSHVTRAQRVHDYFAGPVQGRRGACLQLVLQHNLFNTLLPMRSGELAFPVLMTRTFGIGAARSLPGLLWFRLLDLHAIVLLAAPVLAATLPIGLVAVAALLWLAVPWLAWGASRRLAARIDPEAGRVSRFLARVHAGLPQGARVFWITLGWTLLTWILKLAVFAWLLLAFAPLSLPHALLGAIGGELTSVLPIHGAGGFGTYEAGIIAGTLASGLDPQTLLGAAVNLHLFVLGVALVAGLAAILPWPTGGSRERDPR